jgi:rhodanese-related sulfurtransferase
MRMDTVASAVSASELLGLLGSPRAPLIIDARRAEDFDADPAMIAAALRRPPDRVSAWSRSLPERASVVAYCARGREQSGGVAKALLDTGVEARYLEGGIDAWKAAGGPTMAKRPRSGFPWETPTRWITRERPKIDRIACPWLIRRFIDPNAEFLYVPPDQVLASAARQHAVPYDVPGVVFSHEGELCSFDTFLKRFELNHRVLHDLAPIVRGADTAHPELAPQASGLLAISLGLSALFEDDLEMLERGMLVYDSLFAWLKSAQNEVHNARLFEKR